MLELVMGAVLSHLVDLTGLICMNIVLKTYLCTCTSLCKGLCKHRPKCQFSAL